MKSTILVTALALLVGCAAPALTTAGKTTAASKTSKAKSSRVIDPAYDQAEAIDEARDASADLTTDRASADAREPGDFVTFAFTGSYRKSELRLTQRVVSREGTALTIEYTFAEGKKAETFRVTSDERTGTFLRAVTVAADGTTEPTDQEAFEAKLGATVAMADENDALIDETALTVKVGGVDLPATKSTFAVKVGGKKATLETLTSRAFAWGDLGGKLITAEGKVIFSVELVDAGSSAPARTAALD